MMKTTTALVLVAAFALSGCAAVRDRLDRDPYGSPFWARYATADTQLDRQINRTLEALRQNPNSPSLQNELGALLLAKGFPRDAEREFQRAVANDRRFYPAWYNLGLIRQTQGNEAGAIRAFNRTIALRPGHPAAHFQLGLIYERQGRTEEAIERLARAFAINDALLNPRVNPRILETQLVDRALLYNYRTNIDRKTAQFQATPAGYTDPEPRRRRGDAPSAEPHPAEILSPVAPATERGRRDQPVPPPAEEEQFTLQPAAPLAPEPGPVPPPPIAPPDESHELPEEEPVLAPRPPPPPPGS
jgi:tetratricopeptide (TPR) repeat protein